MIQKKLLIFFLAISVFSFSQVLPDARKVDWSTAGLINPNVSKTFQIINMTDFNVIGDGVTANDSFLANAIASITGSGAILNFPEGTFLFKSPIILTSNLVIKGKRADKTVFKINLTTKDSGIKANGILTSTTTTFSAPSSKGDRYISVTDTANFTEGDWIEIIQNDSDLIDSSSSSWATHTVGQIVKINSISGNTINLVSPLRMDYIASRTPYIQKINPVENVGIECLKIERIDDTEPNQSANIFFQYAVNSWVKAIESNKCSNAHVDIRKSSNLYISNSYFHHGFSYGGGGRAYGVILQSTTNETLVENNVFEHLRHSMLLQTGANGNVFSYNFSTDPYWDEAGFATDKAGDLVLHGNYPYANLFEMNIGKTVVVDNSHLANGPYNTFFRNRLEGYGIFFSASNSPSQNFIGNDITNTSLSFFDSYFTYFFQGSDHFRYGNNNKGTIDPLGSTALADKSYYYNSKPDFVSSVQWASIGTPNNLSVASIPAKNKYTNNTLFKGCCANYWTGANGTEWSAISNWDNGAPTSELDIIIPNVANKPIINSALTTIGNVEIATSSSVSITNIGSLTVNGNLLNKGSFTINNAGSLIVSGTSTGNITYIKNLPNADKSYLVSVPFIGETIENVIANHTFATIAINKIGLATYENNQLNSVDRWSYKPAISTGGLDNGQGISVRLSVPGDLIFTGTLYSGDVFKQIKIGNGAAYNLIGNPFPSFINGTTFLSTNSNKLETETIWIWDQENNRYDAKITVDGFTLDPAQGFFIKSSVSSGNVLFTRENQYHKNLGGVTEETKKAEIKLSVKDNFTNQSNYVKIYYLTNASKGFENGYDGELFDDEQNSFEIYSHLLTNNVNKKYQIQSLPFPDVSDITIPIGIKANAGKEITFSLESLNLPSEIMCVLEDREANTFTNFDTPSSNYTVTLSADLDGVGRFYLHSTNQTLANPRIDLNSIMFYCKNKNLHFLGLPSGDKRIEIYNFLGVLVVEKTMNSNSFISIDNLPSALYVICIETNFGAVRKNIFLK